MLIQTVVSTLVNVVVLGGVPFLGYYTYHRWRWKRRLPEVARRAGLQLGSRRHLGYSLALAVVAVGLLLLWGPPLEALVREDSPQRDFVGIPIRLAWAMALLFGIFKTGFAEELLFRGLIAGSLGRRLSLPWANLWQASIFLIPHLPLIVLAPELRGFVVVIFVGAFGLGWLRIRSDSILGPWLIHAALNVATCLSVAYRTD